MPESPAPRRAAAYLRVSTEEQAELSPESQLAEIRAYARREGLCLLEEQIYMDPGISGKRAERRPAFLRMIAAAREADCPFSVILVWKFSRFARNQEESVFYKSVLRSKCGVEVVSVTEPLAAGPFGSLMERIIEWMDEFYSIRLSQEVKRSMTVNARRGRPQCTAPFGYRMEGGALVPVPEEAALVRLAYERFLAGAGAQAVARELNALGARTRKGNAFTGRAVAYLLQNPAYAGFVRWSAAGKRERLGARADTIVAAGSQPPLVSREVWDAAQERFASRPVPQPRAAASGVHALSGLVRCAACGRALVFVPPGYYRCGGYARGRCDVSQHIPAKTLEAALLSRLREDLSPAPPLLPFPAAPPDGGERAALRERAQRRTQERERRLEDAYLAGVLSLAEYGEARARLRQERAEAEATFPCAAPGSEQALPEGAREAAEAPVPDGLPPEELRAALSAVLADAVLDRPGGRLTLVYRFQAGRDTGSEKPSQITVRRT